MVPTYNCASYLSQTLSSVLAQDPGPELMEIVVVDDCSTLDDPESVVSAVGGGRVDFVRQETNRGHVQTFNTCLRRSRGEWVHLLHGDDYVQDGFYATVEQAFDSRPDLGAVVCRYLYTDDVSGQIWPGGALAPEAGVLQDWPFRLAEGQLLQAPSIAVRRSVYEAVGGFDLGIAGYGEDWEMWLRVAVAAPVWYEPAPRAVYRIRSGSLSDPSKLARNMRDMRRVLQLNEQTLTGVLPQARIKQQTRAARRSLALALLRRAHRALDRGELPPALGSVRESLRFAPSPGVALRGGRLLARWARVRHNR